MEQLEIIKKKLMDMGEDYDALKPFMQEYLMSVETIIMEREKQQAEALATLRGASYSVSDISKTLGCSRTTLYNHNQLLKRYIEHSMALTNANNPIAECEAMRVSKQKLQEQVNLMENRDIDAELSKYEKQILMNRIADKDKEIERLQARIHELSAELHEVKANQKPTGGTILKFN